jgi:hypothetical protein
MPRNFREFLYLSELTSRGRARCNKALELFSLGFGQGNGILFLHNPQAYLLPL